MYTSSPSLRRARTTSPVKSQFQEAKNELKIYRYAARGGKKNAKKLETFLASAPLM